MLLSLLNSHSTCTSEHSGACMNERAHNLKASVSAASLPNWPLNRIKAPAAPSHPWLACVVSSPTRPVRLRLLRAAWWPCSRGPDRRATVSPCATASEQAGRVVSCPISACPAELPIPVASDVTHLTGHGTHPDEAHGRVPGSRERILRRLRSSSASVEDGTSGPRRATM
jgi:hypothetical protein